MKRTILNLVMAVTFTLLPVMAVASPVYADCPTANSSKGQVLRGIDETGSNCSGSGVTNIVATLIEILSYVVGIAAIVMIIWAGFRYITSGGEAGKVGNAKNTLIYALVGIFIAVLAHFIVRVVVTEAGNATKSCPTGQHIATKGKHKGDCIDN